MRKGATARAYDRIKQMIISQELLPGQQIVEANFAKRFNMSRTPIRSAVRLLEEDGLVEIVPNKGAFVRTFTKHDIIACFEMAEALEGMAAFLLAEKCRLGYVGRRDLQKLEKLTREMEESLVNKELVAWSNCDEEFHEEITRMCGNYVIKEEYRRLKLQLNCVLWFITPVYIDKEASNREHRMILDALYEKNPEKARSISQDHRNRVRNELINLFYNKRPQTKGC